jgi:hypothetical protein
MPNTQGQSLTLRVLRLPGRAEAGVRRSPWWVIIQREEGVAIILALMALSLLTAFGVAMLLSSSTEILIAGTFRDQRSALYAADGIAARVADELATMPDWDAVLNGLVASTLVDGPPTGTRRLHDGAAIDLAQVVNMATCQKPTTCSTSDVNAVTVQRPWGANNPQWRLYAYGPLASMVPASQIELPWYVLLMVADDPLQAAGVIAMRAEAFGPRSGHAVIELLAARSSAADSDYNDDSGQATVRILSWREVR